jgi:UDP-3-O-[3-hydroxymyristoyl] N-acetylglucosamine deacetylase
MKVFFTLIVGALISLGASELKIGSEATFPPFEYIDENNKIVGFEIDLIAELSKRVGFSYKIENMAFDAIIPALKIGKIDIGLSGMSATDDRRKSIDFSKPYYKTQNLFLKQKTNHKITDKTSLNGKKIGVQQGSIQELAATKIVGAEILRFENSIAVLGGLKAGKIDAMIVDESVGYGFLSKNNDIVEFLKEDDGSDGIAMAFDKNKHTQLISKINMAIDKMKQDGSYDRLLEKYNLKSF